MYTQAIVQRYDMTLEDVSDSGLSQVAQLMVEERLYRHELQH